MRVPRNSPFLAVVVDDFDMPSFSPSFRGRVEDANPEPRDSGSGASPHPSPRNDAYYGGMSLSAAAATQKQSEAIVDGSRAAARLVRPPSPACCRGAPRRASAPTRIASGCRRSCCSRPTVKAVGALFRELPRALADVAALGRGAARRCAGLWAGLGYYARARNLHACARGGGASMAGVSRHEEVLRALPGIGAYTAAAIAAIAFDRRDHAGRRQYRARDVAALRGRGAAAGRQSRASGDAAPSTCAGDDAAPAISRRR